MLESQIGCLQVEADAEMPSTFVHILEWLTCKSLLAERLVYYPVHLFAIDSYINISAAQTLVQSDFEVGVGSFAVFEAEVRLPPSVFFGTRLVFTVRLLGFSIARVFIFKAT